MATEIRTKRIYDEALKEDGFRVFVDRLWARGVSKADAKIDLWAKELTPSDELREWFHADSSRLDEFSSRYKAELKDRSSETGELLETLQQHQVITLITSTKDLQHGHVAVLKKYLEEAFENS